MVNINKYIKALLHPAGGHQGSHKAHQAGNQKYMYVCILESFASPGICLIKKCRIYHNVPPIKG